MVSQRNILAKAKANTYGTSQQLPPPPLLPPPPPMTTEGIRARGGAHLDQALLCPRVRPFGVGPDLFYCFLLLLHDVRQISVDLVHLRTPRSCVSYLPCVSDARGFLLRANSHESHSKGVRAGLVVLDNDTLEVWKQ